MWALTIAGGKGERLRPMTNDTCKPMVLINGIPLLEHQTKWLAQNGITDIVFLTGYMAEKIQSHFKDGSRFGFRAHYSHEEQPLGRGGAVKRGLQQIPQSETEIIVVNGDILTDQPIEPIIAQRRKSDSIATLMLTPYISEFGIVEIDNQDKVTGFVEKGKLPFWINAGVYTFHRSIEQSLPEIGDHETETFPLLAAKGKMDAYKSNAKWISVDSYKDLRDAEKLIQ